MSCCNYEHSEAKQHSTNKLQSAVMASGCVSAHTAACGAAPVSEVVVRHQRALRRRAQLEGLQFLPLHHLRLRLRLRRCSSLPHLRSPPTRIWLPANHAVCPLCYEQSKDLIIAAKFISFFSIADECSKAIELD